jgi:KaiC/GvpD/RAD55 family RecA-like ATPase
MNVEDFESHRQQRQHKQPPSGPPLIEIGEFIGVSARDRLFLDDAKLLPMRNVVLLSGDGGTGKSLLALQLALATATALPYWIGMTVANGPVIYVSAEDDRDEIHKRVEEIVAVEECADLEASRGLLYFLALAGQDATLAIEQRASCAIKPTDLMGHLDRMLADVSPVLLILDNLADIYAGNENNRSTVKHFVGLLRRLAIRHDCVVLLLAHPSLSGRSNGTGESGSTAWNNSVRSRMYLHRVFDGESRHEADEQARVLEMMKSNYGPVGREIELRWQDGRFIRREQTGMFDGWHHLDELQARFRVETWRCDPRSEIWGGWVIAQLMELDGGRGLSKTDCSAAQKAVRNRIQNMLVILEKNGAVLRVRKFDEHRHEKEFYGAPGNGQEELPI